MHIQRETASKPRNPHDYKGVHRGKYVREKAPDGKERWVFQDETGKSYYSQLIQARIEGKMPKVPFISSWYEDEELTEEEIQLRDRIGVWFDVCAYARGKGGVAVLHGQENKKSRQLTWNIIKDGNYTEERNAYGVLTDVHRTNQTEGKL